MENINASELRALAMELDQLAYDIDPYEYADYVGSDREAHIQNILEDLEMCNIDEFVEFLQIAIDEGICIDESVEEQAKKAIKKLKDIESTFSHETEENYDV